MLDLANEECGGQTDLKKKKKKKAEEMNQRNEPLEAITVCQFQEDKKRNCGLKVK